MADWNDDDRDTKMVKYIVSYKEEPSQSVCDALKQLYKDQENSQYTWSKDDYNEETKKRLQKTHRPIVLPPIKKIVPKPVVLDTPSVSVPVKLPIPEKDDSDDDIEYNDDILENQIYKKCWYS